MSELEKYLGSIMELKKTIKEMKEHQGDKNFIAALEMKLKSLEYENDKRQKEKPQI